MDQNKTTSFIPALGYDFLTAYYDMAINSGASWWNQ